MSMLSLCDLWDIIWPVFFLLFFFQKQMQARDGLTDSFRKTEKAIVQLQGFISRFQV